jgi:hypothetical protein
VDREAGTFEHRAVVVPGRVADPDLAAGNQRARKSAPTFRPPLEPTAWIVTTRPERVASWSVPNSSVCTALRKFAAPSIGRYGFGPEAAQTCCSARRTESSTGMRPASSK